MTNRKLGQILGKLFWEYSLPKYRISIKALIGLCLSFQKQLEEICPHSVSDLRAL